LHIAARHRKGKSNPNSEDIVKEYTYVRRSKYRISNREAQIIGDAFEKCGSRTGSRGVSVEKFAAFCAKPQHPVHEIWKRKRDQLTLSAGRAAAVYLMAAVEIVIIHPNSSAPAGRAIMTIVIEDNDGKCAGVGYRAEDVARRPDLLELAEQEMTRQVRGLAESFAAIAGGNRMYTRLLKIAAEVRELFDDSVSAPSKKPKQNCSSRSGATQVGSD
jgi:hypothetical protein